MPLCKILAGLLLTLATAQSSNSLPMIVIKIDNGKLTVSAGNSSSAPIPITPATLTPTPFPTPHAHPTPKPDLIDQLETEVEDTSTRDLLYVLIALASFFIMWQCLSSCTKPSGSRGHRPTYALQYLTHEGC